MPWVPDGAVGWAGGVTGAVGWAGGVTGAVGLAGFTGLTGVVGLAGTDVEVGAPLVAGAVLEWPCHRASAWPAPPGRGLRPWCRLGADNTVEGIEERGGFLGDPVPTGQ